jgi:hypothetical protein
MELLEMRVAYLEGLVTSQQAEITACSSNLETLIRWLTNDCAYN